MKRAAAISILASFLLASCATAPQPAGLPAKTQQAVAPEQPVAIQLLAINDFHGALETPEFTTQYLDQQDQEQTARLGGAARLAGTLSRLRAGHENTVTVAAGDLIGASPLVSSLFLDEPSIYALNQMGLELAAVGNHEFDRGVDELRRMADGGCEQYTPREPCGLEEFTGAEFSFLTANVVDAEDRTVFPATAMRDFGDIRIGFIGMTLKDTASLVSPAATRGYRFLDEAMVANAQARQLQSQGADIVVLLIHQGVWTDPSFNLAGCPNMSGDLLPVLEALDSSIELVISGHTHNAYVCELTDAVGNNRLLTSAGRHSTFATDIRLVADPQTGDLLDFQAVNVPILPVEEELPETAALVTRYVDAARPIAERVIAMVDDLSDEEGCVDDSAQALVADAQLHVASRPENGAAQIAFINSAGVRRDLSIAEDGDLTFGELFAMQPFANSILVLEMTGAELKAVMEQQFCHEDNGQPCYSRLIPSAGFTYDIDPSRPRGERIVAMQLAGEEIDPQAAYRIAVNNFIANGGDRFDLFIPAERVGGAGVDIDAMEAYFAAGGEIPRCGRISLATSDQLVSPDGAVRAE